MNHENISDVMYNLGHQLGGYYNNSMNEFIDDDDKNRIGLPFDEGNEIADSSDITTPIYRTQFVRGYMKGACDAGSCQELEDYHMHT